MLFILRLFLILCLPVAVFAEPVLEPEPVSEISTPEPEIEPQKVDEKSKEQKGHPSANSTERFVMPVIGWMENKIHKSNVLNPLLHKTKEKTAPVNKTSLRQAILLARQSYPGTVLSARKTTDADKQSLHYKIKILSKNGEIREIEVPYYSIQEEGEP